MKHILQRWVRQLDRTLSRSQTQVLRLFTGRHRRKHQVQQERIQALERECDRLRQEVRDWSVLVDEENQRFQRERAQVQQSYEAQIQGYKQQIQAIVAEREELKRECDRLQLQVWEMEETVLHLEDNVAYLQQFIQQQGTSPPPLLEVEDEDPPMDDLDLLQATSLDLSHLSLALVGGHPSTRRGVIQDLCDRHHLNPNKCVEIPPLTEVNNNLSRVRSRISRCDLIVVITGYMGHNLTDILDELRNAGALSGEVLRVDCRGKSGVIREILRHQTQSSHR